MIARSLTLPSHSRVRYASHNLQHMFYSSTAILSHIRYPITLHSWTILGMRHISHNLQSMLCYSVGVFPMFNFLAGRYLYRLFERKQCTHPATCYLDLGGKIYLFGGEEKQAFPVKFALGEKPCSAAILGHICCNYAHTPELLYFLLFNLQLWGAICRRLSVQANQHTVAMVTWA